ncbi:hypothetical protein CXR34_08250 [Microbacterium hominis]|uniref:Uncharacterized protein n=1 Tax=Microbacterium hominis TaxID=162426 RepID=A0A2K9DQF9_9MICO|nr:hypothetical protein CXR34_08250 [Microbacterium hominis]
MIDVVLMMGEVVVRDVWPDARSEPSGQVSAVRTNHFGAHGGEDRVRRVVLVVLELWAWVVGELPFTEVQIAFRVSNASR